MNTNHKSQLKSLLMIRELIFLVGTILVSVTSEQICSVCGDGYQVGNPSAISSFPGHPDTPTSCKEIEVAGLQELIPISQCRSLPSLIFEACNCQAKTTEKTREKVNALNGPGYSSLRRVQAASPAVASSDLPVATPTSPVFSSSVVAASIVVSPVSPVAPANAVYGGSPVAAPSVYQYSESPHNFYADKQRMDLSIIILALTIVGICFAFAVCSIIATRSGSRIATPQALPTFVISVPASSVVMNGRPAISIGTNGRGLDEDAKRRRTLVLGVLFPNEGKIEEKTEGISTRRGVKYHAESRRYLSCDNMLEDTSCSICMECLGPQDDTVTGMCSHIYHRACIMDWLELGHDKCPNCRQPMWDSETYKVVDQSIKSQQPIPSAPPSSLKD